MFEHVSIDLPKKLKRVEVDGKRYYDVSGHKLVSVTTVTSFQSAKSIKAWRAKVGAEVANKITRQATRRGTDTHTLTEHYLKNEDLPEVDPLPNLLFTISKPYLKNINRIHALEAPLYSLKLGIAGTVDCIAEYNGELAVIDFKTSKVP